ncbi:MAG: hypothetical protein ACRCVA_22680 [Phreatobacter sp.]
MTARTIVLMATRSRARASGVLAGRLMGAISVVLGAVAVAVMLQLTIGHDLPASAASRPASAAPDELAGRWSSSKYGVVLDLSRCGTGWCGVRVEGTTCRDLAMRLEPDPAPMRGRVGFTGTFDRREGADRHAIQANLFRSEAQGGLALSLFGEPGARLQLMRRTFPYQDVLSRIGDAVCRTEAGTS